MSTGIPACFVMLAISFGSAAQEIVSLDTLLARGKRTHPSVLAVQSQLDADKLTPVFDPDDPEILYGAPSGEFFTLGVSQSFKNPLTYKRQADLKKSILELDKTEVRFSENRIERDITQSYYNLLYYKALLQLAGRQDSINTIITDISQRKYATDEGSLFDLTYAENVQKEFETTLYAFEKRIQTEKNRLQLLCGLSAPPEIDDSLYKMPLELSNGGENTLILNRYANRTKISESELRLEKSNWISGFSVSWMNQGARDSEPIYALQLGISVPLWFWKHRNLIKQKHLEVDKSKLEHDAARLELEMEISSLISELNSLANRITYYENTGLVNSNKIRDAAGKSFEAGEMGMVEFVLVLKSTFETQQNYFNSIYDYNRSMIDLNYYTAKE